MPTNFTTGEYSLADKQLRAIRKQKDDEAAGATALTTKTKQDLTRFAEFDTDGNQQLDFEEFLAFQPARVLETHPREQIREWFDRADTNGNGSLCINEFFLWTLENASSLFGTRALELAFERYDSDRTGELDAREFERACADLGFGACASQIFSQLDEDHLGTITYGELVSMLRSNVPTDRDTKSMLLALVLDTHAASTEEKVTSTLIDTSNWCIRATTVAGVRAELKGLLQESGALTSDLMRLFDEDSSPSDVTIDDVEWYNTLRNKCGYKGPPAVCMEIFKSLDGDGSGSIGFDELYEFLHGHRHSLDARNRAKLEMILRPPEGCTLDELDWSGDHGPLALRVLLMDLLQRSDAGAADLLRVWGKDAHARKKAAAKAQTGAQTGWSAAGLSTVELPPSGMPLTTNKVLSKRATPMADALRECGHGLSAVELPPSGLPLTTKVLIKRAPEDNGGGPRVSKRGLTRPMFLGCVQKLFAGCHPDLWENEVRHAADRAFDQIVRMIGGTNFMMAVDILHLTRWLTLSAIEQLTKSAASASPTVPVGHASDLPLSPRAARVKRAMSMKDNSKKAINRYLSELKLKSESDKSKMKSRRRAKAKEALKRQEAAQRRKSMDWVEKARGAIAAYTELPPERALATPDRLGIFKAHAREEFTDRWKKKKSSSGAASARYERPKSLMPSNYGAWKESVNMAPLLPRDDTATAATLVAAKLGMRAPTVVGKLLVDEEELPEEWSAHVAPSGQPYFFNAISGESCWERPSQHTRAPEGEAPAVEEAPPSKPASRPVSRGSNKAEEMAEVEMAEPARAAVMAAAPAAAEEEAEEEPPTSSHQMDGTVKSQIWKRPESGSVFGATPRLELMPPMKPSPRMERLQYQIDALERAQARLALPAAAEEGGGGAPIKMKSLVGNTTISSTYGLSESPLQNKTHERGRQKGWDGSSVQLPIVATTPWERIHERQRSNNPLSARATSARSAR